MSVSIYSTGAKSIRKPAPKPTPPTTVTGRRVTRKIEVTHLSAAKPKQTAMDRNASIRVEDSKPLTAPKKPKAIKPHSTANRRVIPPAKRAKHRVTSTTKKSVTFSLDAPAGSYVAVAGTFSNWELLSMARGQDGIWHFTLPLARGMHQYKFQVDARWQEDPQNARNAANDHGSFNSVCEVV